MNTGSLYAPRDQPEKESKREKKRKKKNTGWPSFFKWGPIALCLKGTLIPCLIEGNKRCKVIQCQPKQYFCFVFIETRIFLQTFPINNIVYIIFCPWRPVNILWPSFDKGFLTRKLIFPWNVFSYISNLCQPQKVLNKLHFSRSKGAVGYKKEPISSKVWCG